MLYVIKFVYSFILPPGIFILLLLAVTIMLWKKARKQALALAGVTLLLYISTTSVVSDALIRSLEQKYTPPAQLAGDAIIMLGGGATSDTPDLGGSGNLSGAAANRLLTVARMYNKTGLPIILSGGQVFSDSGNEAEIAKRQLVQLHVPADVILLENRSLNTEQNAVNTAAILKDHAYTHPILVTSAFHMRRSVLQFEQAGVQVIPYPVDYWSNRQAHFYASKLSPSAGALSTTGTALKEYLGIWAFHLHR